jgi:hypothetical protein
MGVPTRTVQDDEVAGGRSRTDEAVEVRAPVNRAVYDRRLAEALWVERQDYPPAEAKTLCLHERHEVGSTRCRADEELWPKLGDGGVSKAAYRGG